MMLDGRWPLFARREEYECQRDLERDDDPVAHAPVKAANERCSHERGSECRTHAPERVQHIDEPRVVLDRGMRVDGGVDPPAAKAVKSPNVTRIVQDGAIV